MVPGRLATSLLPAVGLFSWALPSNIDVLRVVALLVEREEAPRGGRCEGRARRRRLENAGAGACDVAKSVGAGVHCRSWRGPTTSLRGSLLNISSSTRVRRTS